MKENFEEDRNEKKDKSEPAWYEKRSDGKAWFETGSDWERELSPYNDNAKNENPVENSLVETADVAGGKQDNAKKRTASETPLPQEAPKEINPEESADLKEVFSEEKTNNKEIFVDEEGGKKALSAPLSWAEQGKIYLPDPPPPFELDKIVDQREYIEKNFVSNAAVEQMRRGGDLSGDRKRVEIIAVIIVFGLGLYFFFSLYLRFVGIILLAVGVVLFFVNVFKWRRGFLYTEKISEFFLIKPYAVETECSMLSSREEDEMKPHRLKLYYIENEELGARIERQATTDYIYDRKQLDNLTEAFLSGKLVVACRKGFMRDVAVVCEPEYYLPDDPHF